MTKSQSTLYASKIASVSFLHLDNLSIWDDLFVQEVVHPVWLVVYKWLMSDDTKYITQIYEYN